MIFHSADTICAASKTVDRNTKISRISSCYEVLRFSTE